MPKPGSGMDHGTAAGGATVGGWSGIGTSAGRCWLSGMLGGVRAGAARCWLSGMLGEARAGAPLCWLSGTLGEARCWLSGTFGEATEGGTGEAPPAEGRRCRCAAGLLLATAGAFRFDRGAEGGAAVATGAGVVA